MRETITPADPGLDGLIHAVPGQALAVKAAGFVFCSGVSAVDPRTGEPLHGTIASETRRCFENLELVLDAAGTSLERLAQVHALIYDRIEYDNLNRVYRTFMPAAPPVRTAWSVQIQHGFKVELDVLALVGEPEGEDMVWDRQAIVPANGKLNVSRNFNLPHSPGVRAGPLLYLSGMIAIDPDTGGLALGTMESETRQIFANMRHLLESNGASMADIVKLNVFVYDMLEFENMNRVFREVFADDPPARTTCGVQLSLGAKVEIEAIALIGTSAG